MYRPLVACGLIFCLAACGRRSNNGPAPVVIGAQSAGDDRLAAELVSQFLEKRGYAVERRFDYSGPTTTHEALISDQVGLTPIFAAQVAHAVFRLPLETRSDRLVEQVRFRYQAHEVDWVAGLGYGAAAVVAIPADLAKDLRISTLADAAASREPWKPAVERRFHPRPDGIPALLRHYRFRWTAAPVVASGDEVPTLFQTERVNLLICAATDGLLANGKLRILTEDPPLLPADAAGVVVRRGVLRRHPGLERTLRQLEGRFPLPDVRAMNGEVAARHRSEAQAAAEYLRRSGLTDPAPEYHDK